MAGKVLSILDQSETGDRRPSLFRVPVPDYLLFTYFRYIEDNHNFYIPVSHVKGKTPELYFSTNPRFHFGVCRIFMMKADCEDWCHDLLTNGAKESLLCLPMPAKSLTRLVPRIAADRRKRELPCMIECCAIIDSTLVHVDSFYKDHETKH